MTSTRAIMDEYYPSFEKSLEDLFFTFLPILNQIDFEETLIEILTEMIKVVGYMTDIFKFANKYFSDIFAKNKYDIKILFKLFIFFCLFANEYLIYESYEILDEVNIEIYQIYL